MNIEGAVTAMISEYPFNEWFYPWISNMKIQRISVFVLIIATARLNTARTHALSILYFIFSPSFPHTTINTIFTSFYIELPNYPVTLAILILVSIATCVLLGLFVEAIYFVGRKLPRSSVPNHRMNIIWMISIYPVSISSFAARFSQRPLRIKYLIYCTVQHSIA